MTELIYLFLGLVIGLSLTKNVWFSLGKASGYILGMANAVSILIWKRELFKKSAEKVISTSKKEINV